MPIMIFITIPWNIIAFETDLDIWNIYFQIFCIQDIHNIWLWYFFSEARKKQGTLERVCLNSQVINKLKKNSILFNWELPQN